MADEKEARKLEEQQKAAPTAAPTARPDEAKQCTDGTCAAATRTAELQEDDAAQQRYDELEQEEGALLEQLSKGKKGKKQAQ